MHQLENKSMQINGNKNMLRNAAIPASLHVHPPLKPQRQDIKNKGNEARSA